MTASDCRVDSLVDAAVRERRTPRAEVRNRVKRMPLCETVVRRSFSLTSITHQFYSCCVSRTPILFVSSICLCNSLLLGSF